MGKKKADPFAALTKGFKKIPEDMKKNISKPITGGIDKLKKGAEKVANKAKKEITGGINKVSQGLKIIEKKAAAKLKEIEKKAKAVLNKTTSFFTNLLKKIKTTIMTPIVYIKRFINCFSQIFVSIGSYIQCGLDKIVNIPTCMLFYILDIVYFIAIELPIWFFSLFMPQIKIVTKMIYDILMKIDNKFYSATKYHIFTYQESVLDRCYRCTKLKPFPNMGECLNPKKKPLGGNDPSEQCKNKATPTPVVQTTTEKNVENNENENINQEYSTE